MAQIKPSAAVADILDNAKKPKLSEVTLARVRAAIAQGRELDLMISAAEEHLKSLKKRRLGLLQSDLPAMFHSAGLDELGIPPTDNLPGYDANLKKHFKAVLPPKQEPERRQAAVEMLDDKGAGDLTTTEFKVIFSRGEDKDVAKLRSFLEKHSMNFHADVEVHWATLTSWLKEQFDKGKPLSPGELMKLNNSPESAGATAGEIVVLKKRKA